MHTLPVSPLLLAGLLILAAPAASAQTLRIPADASVPAVSVPRGATMDEVRAQLGEPVQRHQTVGGGHAKRPPITRWDYQDFYVVFERNRAITAGRADQSLPPERTDGLDISSESIGATE